MDSALVERIEALSEKHKNPRNEEFGYGTAGFRMLASKLDSVVFAVGLLAGLRSKKTGKTIGIMITASHNPPEDNGVKIVDPMGEMLDQNWEKYATALANSDNLVHTLQDIIDLEKIDLTQESKIVIGRDSRISGLQLTKSAVDGVESVGSSVQDFGLLTTPQLHYLTRCFNDSAFGQPTEVGYYKKLSTSLIDHYHSLSTVKTQKMHIIVDAANGIGADKVIKLQEYLLDYVEFELINGEFTKPDLLNVNCGADFVKTNQKLPDGVENPTPLKLYCSFDGDADRIVFYYVDKSAKFHLLDGDKIATMLSSFFAETLTPLGTDLTVGIVQTAYANGSSTKFIQEELKIPVQCTPTGVKHLHHKAQQYDVGIYFEANGHGTVLFSDKFIKYVNSPQANMEDPQVKENIHKLSSLVNLINQTVGDAISDLLAVLIITTGMELDLELWNDMYQDLPNKLAKVIVNDRTQFTTTDAERKLVTPKGLQGEIDVLVATFDQGRSFVRASGTEDAVRVYAEAETKLQCDELSAKVVELVKKYS